MVDLHLKNKDLLKYSNNPYYFCDERVLSTVATSFNRSHKMIFAGLWNFRYLKKIPRFPGKIGNRMYIDYSSMQPNLEKYHGIKTIKLDTQDTVEMLENVISELEDNKIVHIDVDRFYLQGAISADRSNHIVSPFIVIGYDSKGFLVVDVHIAEGEQLKYISVDSFLKGCRSCYKNFIVESEKNNIDLEEVLDITINNLGQTNKDAFEAMRKLAEEVENHFSFSAEIEGYTEPLYVPFHFNLYKLFRSRIVFSNTLQYIDKCNGTLLFEDLVDRLKFISLQWDMLRNYFAKYFYKVSTKSNLYLDFSKKISDEILKISEIEEKSYNEFLSTIYNKDNFISNKNLSKHGFNEDNISDSSKYLFADISYYLNNKGFGDLSNTCDADMTTLGHYFYSKGLPENGILSYKDNCFQIYTREGVKNDNISCFNQKIHIAPGNYKEIRFLGCSEYGNSYDKIVFKYKDGTEKEHFFGFPDWILPPLYDEEIVWIGKSIEKKGEFKQIIGNDVYLFSRKINIINSLNLDYIVLPNCNNIHIYAVTLYI